MAHREKRLGLLLAPKACILALAVGFIVLAPARALALDLYMCCASTYWYDVHCQNGYNGCSVTITIQSCGGGFNGQKYLNQQIPCCGNPVPSAYPIGTYCCPYGQQCAFDRSSHDAYPVYVRTCSGEYVLTSFALPAESREGLWRAPI